MAIDRRTFIRNSCLAASVSSLPRWMAAGAKSRVSRYAAAADTVLVVVQLAGGNDGLNTVIPIADTAYSAARPRIALAPSQTLPVDARTALHPNLPNLHRYLKDGKLAIVQGVGYPTPDLSHFRSTDIWESAVPDHIEETGWLGRAMDSLYGSDAETMHAVSWGSEMPGAFRAAEFIPIVVFEPDQFRFETDGSDDEAKQNALRAMLEPIGAREYDFVAHVGKVGIGDSDAIQNARATYASTVIYPDVPLARWFQLTASVIFADVGPRVFWITHGDFDTHDSQRARHDELLSDLDSCLDAFYRDLVEHGEDRRVAVMTWSEFGRRVEDNGSGGTDHGTAAPMFVLGSKVRGGLFGEPPSLTDLDPDGNLRYSVDFRRVYASILANWIDTDPEPILFGRYPMLDIL